MPSPENRDLTPPDLEPAGLLTVFHAIDRPHRSERIGEWWTNNPFAILNDEYLGVGGELYVGRVRWEELAQYAAENTVATKWSHDNGGSVVFVFDRADPPWTRRVTEGEISELNEIRQKAQSEGVMHDLDFQGVVSRVFGPEYNDDMQEEREQAAIVRPTIPEDFPELSHILRRNWLATYPNEEHGIVYAGIEEHVRGFADAESIKGQIAELKDGNLPKWTAIIDGKPVAFANVNLAKNSLEGMYVDPAYHGRGIGRALMETTLSSLDKSRDMFLNAAAYNESAQAFYGKFGFVYDRPSQPVVLKGGKPMPTVNLVRRANPDN